MKNGKNCTHHIFFVFPCPCNFAGKIHYLGGLPASGPLRGTAGKRESQFLSLIRRGGAPSGAAAFIATVRRFFFNLHNFFHWFFHNRTFFYKVHKRHWFQYQTPDRTGFRIFFIRRFALAIFPQKDSEMARKKRLHNFFAFLSSHNNPDKPRNHTTT